MAASEAAASMNDDTNEFILGALLCGSEFSNVQLHGEGNPAMKFALVDVKSFQMECQTNGQLVDGELFGGFDFAIATSALVRVGAGQGLDRGELPQTICYRVGGATHFERNVLARVDTIRVCFTY